MQTNETVGDAPSTEDRTYWLRTIVGAFIAACISVGLTILARNVRWPHPQSIGLAAFLSLIPVLQPARGSRSWAARLAFGLMLAVIGGLIHATFIDR